MPLKAMAVWGETHSQADVHMLKNSKMPSPRDLPQSQGGSFASTHDDQEAYKAPVSLLELCTRNYRPMHTSSVELPRPPSNLPELLGLLGTYLRGRSRTYKVQDPLRRGRKSPKHRICKGTYSRTIYMYLDILLTTTSVAN